MKKIVSMKDSKSNSLFPSPWAWGKASSVAQTSLNKSDARSTSPAMNFCRRALSYVQTIPVERAVQVSFSLTALYHLDNAYFIALCPLSFECIFGANGGGKTYNTVAYKILPAIKKRRRILTNIDGLDDTHSHCAIADYLDMSAMEVESLIQWLDPKESREFHLHAKDGDLIVIDEAHEHFPNIDVKLQNDAYNWISIHHRKMKTDVYFITQIPESMNKKFFTLASQYFVYAKATSIGLKNSYFESVYQGDLSNRIYKSRPKKYRPEIFPCYSGHRQTAVEFKEEHTHKSIWSNSFVLYGGALVILGFAYFVYSLWFADDGILNKEKSTKKTDTKSISIETPSSSRSLATSTSSIIPYQSKSCTPSVCYVVASDQLFEVPYSVGNASTFKFESRVFKPQSLSEGFLK